MTTTERAVRNGKYTYTLAWARALKYNAIPKWSKLPSVKKQMLQIYINAQVRNFSSKKRHQIDHIIPLYGVNICGLHTPSNLRIISKEANQAKSNLFVPYSIKNGRRTFLDAMLPLPEKKEWKPPKRGRDNPTKKSFKRRAKKLIYRKRNFNS